MTAVVVGLTSALAYWFRGQQLVENSQHLLTLASEAEEQGDLSAAIKHLSGFVNLRKGLGGSEESTTEAIARLAGLHYQRAANANDYLAAYRNYEEALRRDPSRYEDRMQLVDVAMDIGRFRDAKEHIDQLIEGKTAELLSEEQRVELRISRARCNSRMQRAADAQKDYCIAIAANPQACEPYEELAKVLFFSPNDLCDRDEVAEFFGTTFPDKADGSPDLSIKVIESILNLMVNHGEPAWESQRLRAQFLASMRRRETTQFATADEAGKLFRELDENQDGIVTASQRLDPRVPTFADLNGDGRIDRAELARRLAETERKSRHELAEMSMNAAIDAVRDRSDAEAHLSTYRTGVDVFLRLAEALQYQEPTEAHRLYRRASESAAMAAAQDDGSPESLLMQARLELRLLGFDADATRRQERFDTAQMLLQNAYDKLAAADAGTDEEEGETQSALTSSVLWTLVDVLISQLELKPAEAAASIEEKIGVDENGDGCADNGYLDDLRALGTSPEQIAFLEGRRQFHKGQWHHASESFRTAAFAMGQDRQAKRRLLLLRAQCAERLGNPDEQLEYTLELVDAEPEWGPGRVAHARAYLNSGKLDAAIRELAPFAVHSEITPEYTRLLLDRETRKPHGKRNWSDIELALRVLEKQAENSEEAVLLRAELLYQQAATRQLAHQQSGSTDLDASAVNQLDQAEKLLTESLIESPESEELNVAYIDLLARCFNRSAEDRVATCQDALTRAIETVGDTVPLRLAAARVAVLQPKPAALATLVQLQPQDSEFDAPDRAQLRKGVARSYLILGDRDLALEQYEQAAQLAPTDISIPVSALTLLVRRLQDAGNLSDEEQRQWDHMMDQLSDIEDRKTPTGETVAGPFGLYFTSAHMILCKPIEELASEDLERALEDLRLAARQRPTWAAVPRMLGELYAKRQDADAAAGYFEQAVEMGERDQSVLARLMQYYLRQRGGETKAAELSKQIAEDRPDLLTGEFAQQALIATRRVEGGELIMQMLLERAGRSQRPADKLLMAMESVVRGQRSKESDDLLEEACNEDPQNPDVWLVRVTYLTRFQQFAEAEAIIAEAKENLPGDPATLVPMTLARCYEALANWPSDRRAAYFVESQRYYEQALQADPENASVRYSVAEFYRRTNQSDKAVVLLDEVLEMASDLSPESRTQALINKALAIAARGTREETERALKLLRSATAPNDAWKVRLLRAEASILDRRNGPGDAQALLDLLEQIAGLETLSAQERFLAAALRDQVEDDWETARREYEQLAEEHPDDVGVLAALVNGLLRRSEVEANLADAQQYFGRLRRLDGDSYRTHAIAVRLAAAKGDSEDAARALAESVRSQLTDHPAEELITQLDEEDLREVSRHLTEVARIQKDQSALQILRRINEMIDIGEEEQARDALRTLGQAQWVVAEVRVEQLRRAAILLEALNHLDLAEQLIREYVESSVRPEAVLALVQFLARRGRHAEGLELCEKHWNKIATQTVANTAVGLLRHGGLGDSDIDRIAPRLQEAIAAIQDPNEKVALLIQLADLRDQQQRYDEVQSLYGEVLRLVPSHIIAANNLAWLMARRGQAAAGLELIEHAIATVGPYPELLDTKGVVLMYMGQADQAIRVLSQAIQQRPIGEIYLHLAEAYERGGDRAAAREALEKAESAGLDVDRLHRLDRAEYDRLLKSLAGS